jgi:hypothetical protein
MSDLAVAAAIGLGFTPSEIADIQNQVQNAVTAAGSKIEAAILAKGNQAITAVAQQAKALVTQQAAEAGQRGADAARAAVIKYSLIAAGVGIVGGGILGWQLAKRLR